MTTVFYRDKSTPLPEENSTVAHYTITSFIDETRSSILFLGFDQTINQKVSQSIDHIKYQDEVSIDYHNEYHNIPVLSNQVVLKFIKVTELSEKATESEINISRFLSSFHHPHIINIFEDFSYQPYRVLSMEFAPFGSLKDLYDPTRTFGLNEDTVLTITFQILEALEFMHRNNIWHRDIKLENILVFDNNAKFPYVKISDFGLAVNVQNNHPNDRVGSLGYVAPEVVKGNQCMFCFGYIFIIFFLDISNI
ncbi:AGC family protein kinase [Tritrichomonas foetus]|uniref:AGC family protein kinase n=1 Tax=Tritrichomonas foetus TaxID=1144522 RepID=A0A1J4KWJ4_9EUKA|nr:AGC family protein kinase [Tritrichomonas foetus]|eukprot:OHT15657.1 AGC family protein kinase [Tritrichomonas foetus]